MRKLLGVREDLSSLFSETGSGVYHACFRVYFARKSGFQGEKTMPVA